jgi:hypothetical protein
MEKPESSEVYTLSLCSNTSSPMDYYGPMTDLSLSNLCWRIDYDNLFKGRHRLFKHCRVRFNLVNSLCNASITYAQNTGYLSAEFVSDYNASTTVGQTILGLISPRTPPVSALSTQTAFVVDGRNDIGVDINPEQFNGVQQVYIRLINTQNNIMSYTTTNNYFLELMFELYNE